MYHVWGDERFIQGFGGGNLRGSDHIGDLGIDRGIILKWNLQEWGGGHGLWWSGSG
jgi:hypothetical protein